MQYTELVTYNIYEQIQLLETTYAESLADGEDPYILARLWDRIKHLRDQVQFTQSNTHIEARPNKYYQEYYADHLNKMPDQNVHL